MLLTVLYELCFSSLNLRFTFFSQECFIYLSEVSNRIRGEFIARRMNFSSYSLIIRSWNHANSVNFCVGQHINLQSFNIVFKFIAVIIRVFPRISVWFDLFWKQLIFPFSSLMSVFLLFFDCVLRLSFSARIGLPVLSVFEGL